MFLPLENNPDSLVLNLSLNLRVDTAIDSLDNMEKSSVKYMAAKFFQESSHAPMAYPRSFSNSWDRQRCPKQAYEHITPSPNTPTHTLGCAQNRLIHTHTLWQPAEFSTGLCATGSRVESLSSLWWDYSESISTDADWIGRRIPKEKLFFTHHLWQLPNQSVGLTLTDP